MDNREERLSDALTAWFEAGIKKERHKEIGVEVEHFLLDPGSGRAVSYYGQGGVGEILAALMDMYPEAVRIPGENLLGFSTPSFNITLEPAAQFEISITYSDSVSEITEIYKQFREKLDAAAARYGACVCTFGCQPVSEIEELQLIPKKRYALMDRYFREAGTDGPEMMRGTCSTQVSVDYFSEEDFRRKMQAAYYYTPLFKLLTANSPMYQGRKTTLFLNRADIWNRTDPRRCGVVPGVFSEHFGFRDYAEFLIGMPLIFLERDGDSLYTGMKTTGEVFEEHELRKEDLPHIISMAFPDVRLKQYLEIRAADSLPADYIPAYLALVQGLMYSEKVLDHVQEQIRMRQITGDKVRETEQSLITDGFEGYIYGVRAADFAEEAISLAGDELGAYEREALGRLAELPLHGPANCKSAEKMGFLLK